MDTNELQNKYNKRKLDSVKWMTENNMGIIINDEFISPYEPNTKIILEDLQKMYDKYQQVFDSVPLIGMFTVARQKELITEAIEKKRKIDVQKLMPDKA